MADPSNEPASSSGVAEQVAATAVAAVAAPLREEHDKPEDFHEPDKKRRRTTRAEDTAKTEQKLEHRLGGILCCAVCLDLPRAAVYQVGLASCPPSPSPDPFLPLPLPRPSLLLRLLSLREAWRNEPALGLVIGER